MLARLRLLQRWIPAAIAVATVALVAAFLAFASMCWLLVALGQTMRAKAQVGEAKTQDGETSRATSWHAPRKESPDPAAILARNVFDDRTGSLPEVPPEPSPPRTAPQADPSTPCELPLRLTAVLYDSRRPARSLAMLRGPEPGSSRVSFAGMRFGDHTLAELLPRSARFEHNARSCWLRMFSLNARDKIEVERSNLQARVQAAKKRGRSRARRPEIQAYPPTRALSPVEVARGIRERHPGSYLLDAKTLERALERWDHVAATTRISPIRRKSARGLRIVSLRNDGLLANIGLRTGDVLRAVNGRSITRERDLRRTIARFARGERVTLALLRGGQQLTFHYAPL